MDTLISGSGVAISAFEDNDEGYHAEDKVYERLLNNRLLTCLDVVSSEVKQSVTNVQIAKLLL